MQHATSASLLHTGRFQSCVLRFSSINEGTEMTRSNYADPAWKQTRLAILARDGYRCQLGLPKCRGRATEVDHIRNIDDGGARLDPANLRASCKSCNVAKRNSDVAARAREARRPPPPANDTPRWWRYMVSGWEPISARFADPEHDVFAATIPNPRRTS
jgi:5-methylcytosine-specific restriction protein A